MNRDSTASAHLDVACHINVMLPDAAPRRPGAGAAFPGRSGLLAHRPASARSGDDRRGRAGPRLRRARHRADHDRGGSKAVGLMSPPRMPDERAAGAAALRSIVDLTAALGGDQMNGVPYGPFGPPAGPTSRAAVERSAREVGAVADYAHAARNHDDLRGAQPLRDLARQHCGAGRRLRGDERVGAPAHPPRHLPHGRRGGGHGRGDPHCDARARLPRVRSVRARARSSTGAVDIPEIVRSALDDGYQGRWGVEAFSRSVLSTPAADMLAIWRAPYDDGAELAADAMRVIQRGWSVSVAGRRAQRLSRGIPA